METILSIHDCMKQKLAPNEFMMWLSKQEQSSIANAYFNSFLSKYTRVVNERCQHTSTEYSDFIAEINTIHDDLQQIIKKRTNSALCYKNMRLADEPNIFSNSPFTSKINQITKLCSPEINETIELSSPATEILELSSPEINETIELLSPEIESTRSHNTSLELSRSHNASLQLCKLPKDIIGEIGKWLTLYNNIHFEMTCKDIFYAIRKSKIYYELDAEESYTLIHYSVFNNTRFNWNKFKYVDNFVLQCTTNELPPVPQNIYHNDHLLYHFDLLPFIPNLKHLSIKFASTNDPEDDATEQFLNTFNRCKFQSLQSIWAYNIQNLININTNNMPSLQYLQIHEATMNGIMQSFQQIRLSSIIALHIKITRLISWLHIPNQALCSNLQSLIIPNINFNINNYWWQNLEEMIVQGCMLNPNKPLLKLKRIHLGRLLQQQYTQNKDMREILDIPSLELFSADFQQNKSNSVAGAFIYTMIRLSQILSKLTRKHLEIYLWLAEIPPWNISTVIDALSKNNKIEEFEVHIMFTRPKKYFSDISEPIYDKIEQECIEKNLSVRYLFSAIIHNVTILSVKNHHKKAMSANKWIYDHSKFYDVSLDDVFQQIQSVQKGLNYYCPTSFLSHSNFQFSF